MLFRRIEIENYRIIRELSVNFNEDLTLIVGTNETGKSTLAEALHRVLFLSARGQSEQHQELRSRLFGGIPEVTLEFESSKQIFRLKKVFGTEKACKVTLECLSTGDHYEGDNADAKLSEILCDETGLNGKALKMKWQHLWIYQGASGMNPMKTVEAETSRFLNGIQQLGGAILLQSAKDQLVMDAVSKRLSELFTQEGKPRANTPLQQAGQHLLSAKTNLDVARKIWQDLDNDVKSFITEKKLLDEQQRTMEAVSKRITEVNSAYAMIVALRQNVTDQMSEFRFADQQYQNFTGELQKLGLIEKEIATLQQELTPLSDKIREFGVQLQAALKEFDHIKVDLQDRETKIGEATQAKTLCGLLLNREGVRGQLKDLKNRNQRINDLKQQEQQKILKLAAEIKVEQADVKRLENLEQQVTILSVELKSISTRIELQAADVQVQVNAQTLSVGEMVTVNADAEVQVGKEVKLKIFPGGGQEVGKLRDQLEKANKSLADAYTAMNVSSLEEARAVWLKRTALAQDLAQVRSQLSAFNPEQVADQLNRATASLQGVDAEIRRMDQLSCFTELNSMPEIELLAYKTNLDQRVQLLTEDSTKMLAKKVKVEGVLNEIQQKKAEADKDVAVKTDRLDGRRKELQAMEVRLGNSVIRESKRMELEKTKTDFQSKYEELKRKLAALNPDAIEEERTNLPADLANMQGWREQKLTLVEQLRARIETSGYRDPREELEKAEVEYQKKKEEVQLLQNKGDAWELLSKVFKENQEQLTTAFTRPLAEKAEYYLKRLFGSQIKVLLKNENNTLSGLSIKRLINGEEKAFDFDKLSGGTKEQVGVALRLAMVEVLAKDHGGHLPLVIDEGFTHTDDERLANLMPMLSSAAGKGPQLILMAHRENDFVRLGVSATHMQKVVAN